MNHRMRWGRHTANCFLYHLVIVVLISQFVSLCFECSILSDHGGRLVCNAWRKLFFCIVRCRTAGSVSSTHPSIWRMLSLSEVTKTFYRNAFLVYFSFLNSSLAEWWHRWDNCFCFWHLKVSPLLTGRNLYQHQYMCCADLNTLSFEW